MNPYLLSALEFGPVVIRRLLVVVPPEILDAKPDPERFTLREVLAHLADWEPLLLERMRTAMTAPGTTIETYDEGERAVTQRYGDSDPWDEMDRWAESRKKTIEFLRLVPKEAWSHSFVHPEHGIMTLADQANMLIGHDLYHIEQFTADRSP